MSITRASKVATALAVGMLCLYGICHPSSLHAQTPTEFYSHPELYIQIQDSLFLKRTHGSELLDTNEYCFSATYQYEMIYDSTSRIGYTFSECKRNNTRLHLRSWQDGRLTTAPIPKYNDSSRTDDFVLAAGDTVSFYRDFRWYNPQQKRQELNNYFSTDTLDFVVDLVDAATGGRLALLDSMGALPCAPPGTPVLYGAHPIIAMIKYAVPPALAGNRAFVRVSMFARGDGLYQPIRLDGTSIGLSRSLALGQLDGYLALFGGGLGKEVGRLKSTFESDSRHSREIRVSVGESRTATIGFDSPGTTGSISLVIYDALGNPVFVPYTTNGMAGAGETTYRFPSSGMFIVALLHNNDIEATTKVMIK